MKRKPIQFPIEFHQKLKEHCVKKNVSMMEYIMFLVEEDWTGFIQSGNTETKVIKEPIVPRETLGVEFETMEERIYYNKNQHDINFLIDNFGYTLSEAIVVDMETNKKKIEKNIT